MEACSEQVAGRLVTSLARSLLWVDPDNQLCFELDEALISMDLLSSYTTCFVLSLQQLDHIPPCLKVVQ